MEETLRYLYHHRPGFEDFANWMTPKNNDEIFNTITGEALSEKDILFFKKNGYVLINNALTGKQCQEARQAILNFLEADINDPATWYKDHDEMRGLMLMFYHHPALEIIRNSPLIRKAYEQLYGSVNIHKVIDKVSFNPPETSTYNFKGSPLHWDVSLALPIPFKLQGLLYLSDVTADGGAFNCVPGFHLAIEDWIKSLPVNTNPRDAALSHLKPEPVIGKEGDFIIWHQALPHCATANRSNTPRFVQYHTYDPDDAIRHETWI